MQTERELADTLLRELFPICRSLTGNGNRQTLDRLAQEIPINIEEVPSGGTYFDWEVPPEWNIRDAWIKDSSGRKVVDFKDSNLHVVNYSTPVQAKLSFEELKDRIHTLPEMPDAWPYRHSYYKRDWGFCMAHAEFEKLNQKCDYEVFIDSDLDPDGSMTIADCRHQGTSGLEYIVSTYCCHPSLANDNLSGLVLSVLLFKRLLKTQTFHSYRLIIAPETIGIISYLHLYQNDLNNVAGGYVVTTVGGPGEFGYKPSFAGNNAVDLAAAFALKSFDYKRYQFRPDGSDERQYSSPSFRIPTGTITKDKYYEYREYHTSADNLDFVSADNLVATLDVYWAAIQNLERNRIYERIDGHCEIQLGKHGLYPTTGGAIYQPAVQTSGVDESSHDNASVDEEIDAMSWLMFACDGKTPLLDIAERSSSGVKVLFDCAMRMVSAGVLHEVKR